MRVKVGDVNLFFDVDGAKLVADGPRMKERPTLLLLHGGPGADHTPYKPAFSQLTDIAQIVYLDHRGCGRSDPSTPDRWYLRTWVDDVKAFCDTVGIEKPIVLGTSFGGFVAMAYASRYPDHPAKVILNTTSGKWRQDRVLATFERLGGKEVADAARRMLEKPELGAMADFNRLCFPVYNRTPADPDVFARFSWNTDLVFHFFGGEIKKFDVLGELSKVKCPTLVLGGEEDPITPIADSEDIAAALPSHLVRFERFAGAGHQIVPDKPDAFFRVVREFIAS